MKRPNIYRVVYYDNHITLSAAMDMTFTEDRARRFEAVVTDIYGRFERVSGRR